MAMVSVNVTDVPGLNTADDEMHTFIPASVNIINGILLTAAIIGIVASIVTFVTLTLKGNFLSKSIRMLFRYQSILDCLCCLQASVLFTLPRMWETGNNIFDVIICLAWHSHICYWVTMTLSIWNLVTIAVDRYLCVCHPLKYQTVTPCHFRLIKLSVALFTVFFISSPLFLTYRHDGQCKDKIYSDEEVAMTFFQIYGISCFCFMYIIPCVFFFILYGLIINRFRQRAWEFPMAGSTVINNASNQLTKTPIAVTAFFIILIRYDSWYFLLGKVGASEYVVNSAVHRVDVLFAVMNCVVNPFIYALLMPVYRKSVEAILSNSCSSA